MNKAEQYFYNRGRYGEIAARVDTCLRIAERGCVGEPCDLDAPCWRHARVVDIEARYYRRFKQGKESK